MTNVAKTSIHGWPVQAGVFDISQAWVRRNGTLTRLQTALDYLGVDGFSVDVSDPLFGAAGNAVATDGGVTGTNDAAAFQAAIDYVYGLGGGEVTFGKRHLIDGDLNIKRGVRLRGHLARPGYLPPTAGSSYGDVAGVLFLNSTYPIRLQQRASLTNCTIIRKGQIVPITSASVALTDIAAFAGTAVKIEDHGAEVDSLLILGFAQALSTDAAADPSRIKITQVHFDCTAGLLIDGNYDTSEIRQNRGWPYLTATLSNTTWTRSGAAFKTGENYDWGKFTECFSYGYAYGFHILDADDVSLIGCGADYVPSGTSTSIGVYFGAGTLKGTLIGFQAAAHGRGVVIENGLSSSESGCVEIIGSNFWSIDDACIDVITGRAIITNCHMRGPGGAVAGGIGIRAGASAGALTITGNEFDYLTTPLSINATPLALSTIHSNRNNASTNPLVSDRLVLTGNSATSPLEVVNAANSAGVPVGRRRGSRSAPANNDLIYETWELNDAGGNATIAYRQNVRLTNVTDTAEAAQVYWGIMTGGTLTDRLLFAPTSLSPVTSEAMSSGASSLPWSTTYTTSINLGHASDTTLTRSAAGRMAVEGIDLALDTFLQSGTGAVTRTLQAKARDAVSVLDFIPVAEHANILAGTSTDDVAAYINAALTAHKHVWFPAGLYYIGQGAQITPVTGNRLSGPGTLTKYSALTARTDNLIVCSGVSNVIIDGLTLAKGSGNHLAVHVTGASSGIHVRNCRVENLLSFIDEGATNVSFRKNDFILGSTAQGAVAVGGVLNPSTGIGERGTGIVRGFAFEHNYVNGCTTEAVDVNWNLQHFSISYNYFDECSSTAGNELIDIGGAGLRSATVTAGGTGYVTNDTVTMDGGYTNGGAKATFTVTASAGAVTALTLTDGGYYYRFPTGTSGVATTATSGVGTGLTIAPVYGYCGHGKVVGNRCRMIDATEKRAFRIKWNCKDILVADNTVDRPTMPGSESTVQSDFLSIEQSDDITVRHNRASNMQQGVVIDGPCSNIKIIGNTFRNIRRNALSTGSSLTTTADVDGVEWIDNIVEMLNIASGEEVIDLAYATNYRLRGGSSRLATSTTEDHIEIRATSTGAGHIEGMHCYGGRYGILGNSGAGRLVAAKNHFELTGREAIYLTGMDDCLLEGNDCNDNANDASVYAITLDSCDDATLIGNKIRAQLRGIRVLTDGARHRWVGNDIDCATPFLTLNLLTNPVIENNIVQSATTGTATVATDAAFTVTPFTSAPHQIHTGTLTADRAVTLSTTNAVIGMKFRFTRSGAGAFNLNIGSGPLKGLATNTWCEVTYNGSAWVLSAYGAL